MKEQSDAVLLGDWGTKLTVIECGAARDNVVVTDDSGSQVMSEAGATHQIDTEEYPGAPSECPLRIAATSRTVGQFATCSNCCLGWLKDANGIAFI